MSRTPQNSASQGNEKKETLKESKKKRMGKEGKKGNLVASTSEKSGLGERRLCGHARLFAYEGP